MRRRLAALAIACAAAPAAAEPAIVLDQCTSFDRVALRAAIERELAAAPPDPRRDDLTLVVQCPDTVTARLSVELPPPALPLVRSLDLGEVAGELRPKLLAVAASELIEGALAAPRPPAPDEPAPADASTATAPPAPAPAPAAPSASTGAATAIAPAGPRPPPTGVRADLAASPRPAVVPRLGMRLYVRKPIPFAHLAVDYERRWFAVGVAGSIGATDVTLGSLTAYLATASASTRPLCAGGDGRVCLRARGELGLAAVTVHPASDMVVARNAHALYAQLGLVLDAERAFGAVSALAAVEAAWAEGLVAVAQDRPAIQLDGTVVTVLVGMRWRP
jgi:hypothetical protein